VATYRGGYLADERRDLEQRLRSGSLACLVTTSALELGIDVSGLDAVVTVAWPGTRASLWQQIGRVGRAGAGGLAVWVAGGNPLDAYVVEHPDAVFGEPLETTVFDPTNPRVLAPHACAAAAELPLTPADEALFGPGLEPILGQLEAAGVLRHRSRGWYWLPSEPATALTDLRGAGEPTVQIVEAATGALLGTVDGGRADSTVHTGAVYVHQGVDYLVEALDLEAGLALVRRGAVPFRTRANSATSVAVLATRERAAEAGACWSLGEVEVRERVTSYTRLSTPGLARMDTVPLDLPERTLVTTACWFTLDAATLEAAELTPADIPGALHALEHCAIGLLPLLATCDRWDLGGLSTARHADTDAPTVFIHDAVPGGAGFAERGFRQRAALLTAVYERLNQCPCVAGCPACIQSPKCGNANQTLDKAAATRLARMLTQG
jgi:DEAD/DEAH box helicase domain-containing protein